MRDVFVYGTLMRGFGNHYLIEAAELLDADVRTSGRFEMFSLGCFPGVTFPMIGTGVQIRGELYRVAADTFARLDQLEGCPSFYTRDEIELEIETPRPKSQFLASAEIVGADGTPKRSLAWMYLLSSGYVQHRRCQRIPSGDWREFVGATTLETT